VSTGIATGQIDSVSEDDEPGEQADDVPKPAERARGTIGLLIFESGGGRLLTRLVDGVWVGAESWMEGGGGVSELSAAVSAACGIELTLVAWEPLMRERDEYGRSCAWYACVGEGKASGTWRWCEPETCTQGALGRLLAKWPGVGKMVNQLAEGY
jgi:hypothetical protein